MLRRLTRCFKKEPEIFKKIAIEKFVVVFFVGGMGGSVEGSTVYSKVGFAWTSEVEYF